MITIVAGASPSPSLPVSPYFSAHRLCFCLHSTLHSRRSTGQTDRQAAMAEASPVNSLPKPLRILFCGLECYVAESYTRKHLQQFPHLSMDACPTEEVLDRIADYDICIPAMARIDAPVIARAKRLQLIVQFGVGLDGVDIEAATRAGIKVARISSAFSGTAITCAEHCIYMIFGLLRHQREMASSIAARRLAQPAGSSLYGKTVFILGYGNIGKELARRLTCFGVKILAVRRCWPNSLLSATDICQEAQFKRSEVDDFIHEKGGTEHTLEFASRADIVVTCCSLNPSTNGIVDAKFLATMKEGAYIVNVARGGILDYDAVMADLQSGHLGGLAMDVAWSEPIDPSDPILEFPNVLITPHVASLTGFTHDNMASIIADSVHQLSNGKPTSAIEYVN